MTRASAVRRSTCETSTPNQPESLLHVEVGAPEVVPSTSQRRARQLDYWVDGTFGVHRDAARTLVIAPNGPRYARHELGPEGDIGRGLIAGVRGATETIQGLPDAVAHASGGPLFHDPITGLLVVVYHGETFRNGDSSDYYSFLGMAASHDGGSTFRDLGRIITSELEEHDAARPRPVDVGSGAFVVVDDWFLVYFQDRGIIDMRRNLAVARASVAEVFDAATAGRAPEFRKRFEGEFTEPGLGGRSDELISPANCRIAWFDSIYLEQLGCVGLVASRFVGVAPTDLCWTQQLFVSGDGIDWRGPFDVGSPQPAEMLYVSLDSGGPDPRRSEDGTFDLYRTRSTTSFRWDDAQLERLRVRVRGDSVTTDG